MPHKITVRTNGQTLTVNASVSHWTSEALALAASGDDDVASSTTTTITSDYDLWFANTATTAVITVKSADGTTLIADTFQVSPAYGNRTLAPAPTPLQLAADTAAYDSGFLASTYYYYNAQSVSTTTTAITINSLRLAPFFVPNSCTISKIGAEVTSAGGTGSVFRIGIYADNGAAYPGSLVLDAGTIDGESATVQDITLGGSAVTLSRGLYWFGGAAQVGTQPTMRVSSVNAYPMVPISIATSTPSANATAGGYSQASVTGALPATFTTTRTATAQSGLARIHFLVA